MAESRQSLAFLLCVEAGPLEQQSILLARSIRAWAGAYGRSPIHAFRLREGPRLASATYDALSGLDVTVHEEVLNREHHDYVHANTTYAMVWAEENLSEEIIVWADSDKVFLSDPVRFDLPAAATAAGTAPYYRGRARGPKSGGPGDPFDPYWQRLYEMAGVTEEPYVTALIDGARLRAFWNGGLIVFRRSAGLAHEWLDLMSRVLREGHVPAYGVLNVDQLTLAALLARTPRAVEELDHRYNHNLALRALLPEPQRSFTLAELKSVHYHSWFNRRGFLEDLRPKLERDDRYEWLQEVLPLEPANERPLPKRRRGAAGSRPRRRFRRLRRRLRRSRSKRRR